MRQIRIIAICAFSLLILFGGHKSPILASVMQSDSYRIQFDSINFYGGRGTSSSYNLEDTGGEIATGDLASASYKLHAGYQQSPSYISIAAPAAVNLTPPILGVTGGAADGSGNVTVTTDDLAGYTLQIRASTAPAMQNGIYSFADYSVGGAPDFAWLINATDSEFGFTPEGADLVQRYLDNGANACNQAAGTDTADSCWDALTTSDVTISKKTGANNPAGSVTTLKFKAESGTDHLQIAGTYTATVTVTAFIN